MKLGNVILALFFWCCIPFIMLLGVIGAIPYSLYGGSSEFFSICICGSAFLVFIIGLVILLMGMEKNKKSNYHKQPQNTNRRCPSCGRVIPEDAKRCPYCASEFE